MESVSRAYKVHADIQARLALCAKLRGAQDALDTLDTYRRIARPHLASIGRCTTFAQLDSVDSSYLDVLHRTGVLERINRCIAAAKKRHPHAMLRSLSIEHL